MTTTPDAAMRTYELRIQTNLLGDDGPAWFGLFVTDPEGQWLLVCDGEVIDQQDAEEATAGLMDTVRAWFKRPVSLLPAF